MIHSNHARLEGGVLHVDRKFHTGMQEYARVLGVPLLTVHPEASAGQLSQTMDTIAVPEAELGYRVMTLKCSAANRPLTEELARLRPEIARSQAVYAGPFSARAVVAMCRESGVPYIALVEYNLKTTVVFAIAGVARRIEQARRAARAVHYYLTEVVPFIRGAALVHCNGYPVFDEARWLNPRRLLYLDSRMPASMLIEEARLEGRLAERRKRAPRLIFSGRFEPAKGALDVVEVAAHPSLRDVPCEFVLYGQGSQRAAMNRLVEERGLLAKVEIHDPVPYPELVGLSGDCDVFVCCHVQDDPSCTYLEAMGCGLPIVGYGNGMWKAMHADSGAGVVTKLGAPEDAAQALRMLLADGDRLDALSRRARSFAARHTFEQEFGKRTRSIEELISRGRRPSAAFDGGALV
jgi:glycosyltransferase involved in cell wall biosynthesis